ncbi:phosphate propanoyltransferase [bacterium]|nr:phosphate propanoyltransferase [candidate division CSSED10-310 bacterium]
METLRSFTVPVGVSARHAHLTQTHIQVLFNNPLHVLRDLSQKGEYAAREKVTAVSPQGSSLSLRVLGPARNRSQIELARTDAVLLGMNVPLRLSGNLDGSPGITLVGPAGTVLLKEGVIVAVRHLHITPMEANRYGLNQDQTVQAVGGGSRRIRYDAVAVRISDSACLELHLDTDEANAADLKSGDTVQIIVPDPPEPGTGRLTYVTAEDIHALIRSGKPLKLPPGRRITPAALELAKSRGVLITE